MRRTLLLLGICSLLPTLARAQDKTVEQFDGPGAQTTSSFQVQDQWRIQWTCPDVLDITVLAADGSVIVESSAAQQGTLTLPKGGSYSLRIARSNPTPSANWHIRIIQPGPSPASSAMAANVAASPPNAATPAAQTPAPPVPASTPPAPTSLTEAQAHAVVVVKGDVAEGTGFLVKGPDGPAVVTNLHVISANPNVKIFTTTGEEIQITGLKGASDRDLALIAIKDNHYSYLELATDIPGTVQNGDEVITPGNSEGGEVVLDTRGTVLGVGPEQIEISNPIYHGNSGGPVVHLKSGKVIAVVSKALKVRPQDELDRASFANKNSAIIATMRYFGYRLDTVPKWETYDWNQFFNETEFISHFHDLSRCLDSFLNGAAYERARVASADEYGPPDARYYQKNPKIVEVHDTFHRLSADAGDSQRLDAVREMIMDLDGIAATDLDTMQRPGNFYSFDEIRVQQEIKYRQALQKEIDSAGDRISDLGH